jgi:hypothetical protein
VFNGLTVAANLLCYLPTKSWVRLSNQHGQMFAATTGVSDELYMADRATPQVLKVSPILAPSSGNVADADGTIIEPFLETRPFGADSSEKRFGDGRVTYDMRSSSDALLRLSAKTSLEADTVYTPGNSLLAPTTRATRKRFTVAKETQAVTMLIRQTGASNSTDIFTVEIDQRGEPAARLDDPA